jgi:hypothetical protein
MKMILLTPHDHVFSQNDVILEVFGDKVGEILLGFVQTFIFEGFRFHNSKFFTLLKARFPDHKSRPKSYVLDYIFSTL